MIWTEMIGVPSVRVSTVATSSDISLELHIVAFVISFLEALLADNACRIFFAIKTPPGHIASWQLLRAHCCLAAVVVLIKMIQYLLVLPFITGPIKLYQALREKFTHALFDLLSGFPLNSFAWKIKGFQFFYHFYLNLIIKTYLNFF